MDNITYRNFRIDFTTEKKWSYKEEKMIDTYGWDIKHQGGYILEHGKYGYEDPKQCENDAERAVDKLCSGGW